MNTQHENGRLNEPDLELEDHLKSEESAVRYLEKLRWPDGFVCPHCSNRSGRRTNSRRPSYVCSGCHRSSCVTTKTIFQYVRSVRMTMRILQCMLSGMSACAASKYLNISYAGAWNTYQKGFHVLDEHFTADSTVGCSEFTAVLFRRSKETPALEHPLAELRNNDLCDASEVDELDPEIRAQITRAILFIRSKFQGISRKYLAKYLAGIWANLNSFNLRSLLSIGLITAPLGLTALIGYSSAATVGIPS